MMKMSPTEGISAKVRRMSPARYTVREAADLVGRHPDTLVRWRKTNIYKPSDSMKMGKIKVHLYTDADIEGMKQLAKVIHPGRPRKDEPRPWVKKQRKTKAKA
jgi:hypothetical protein